MGLFHFQGRMMLQLYAVRCIPLVLCIGCAIGARQVQLPEELPGTAPSPAASMRDDSISVAALEQRVETAAARRDAAFLNSVWAPTFRFTHAGGTVQTRQELLSQFRQPLRSNGTRTLAREVDSLSVEMHHNSAVTSGIIHVRQCTGATYRGYMVRFIRVYRRSEAGHWQLLSHRTIAPTQPESPTSVDCMRTLGR